MYKRNGLQDGNKYGKYIKIAETEYKKQAFSLTLEL